LFIASQALASQLFRREIFPTFSPKKNYIARKNNSYGYFGNRFKPISFQKKKKHFLSPSILLQLMKEKALKHSVRLKAFFKALSKVTD